MFLPDELFNKSLGSLEKEFIMFRQVFGKISRKNNLQTAIANCED